MLDIDEKKAEYWLKKAEESPRGQRAFGLFQEGYNCSQAVAIAFADLIGMDVLLENGEKFGVLRDVMETGANDVYIVDRVDGEEILLPAIHDCVLDVDVEKNTMTVHLMKGLV